MDELFEALEDFSIARDAYREALDCKKKCDINAAKLELDRAAKRLYAACGDPFGQTETGFRLWETFQYRATSS